MLSRGLGAAGGVPVGGAGGAEGGGRASGCFGAAPGEGARPEEPRGRRARSPVLGSPAPAAEELCSGVEACPSSRAGV